MKKAKWEHIIIIFIGLWLMSIRWTVGWGFGPNDINVVMWNFLMVGAAVIITSIIALRNIRIWAEWLNLFMGTWLILSPLLLIYYKNSFFLWNSILFGVAIVGLSAISIPIAEKQRVYNRLMRKNQRTHNRAIKH
jgi:hypothetical protein